MQAAANPSNRHHQKQAFARKGRIPLQTGGRDRIVAAFSYICAMRKVYHYRVARQALLLLAVAPAFVALCVLLLAERSDNLFIWIVSLLGILFFGGAFLIGLIDIPRMVRNSEALILTPEALTIRQIGRPTQSVIRWTEIAGFSELYIKGQHFISPQLRSPEPHFARERNSLLRTLMKLNTRVAGSPYNIAPDSLRCDPDELIATLVGYLEKYGRTEADAACKR